MENEGKGNGYVSKIKTELPEGVRLLENSEINKKYEWKQDKSGVLEIDRYSIENSFESELKGKNIEEDIEEDIEESAKANIEEAEENKEKLLEELVVEIEVEVTNSDKEDEELLINFEIEQQDINGEIIEYDKEEEENSKDKVTLDKKYFDAKIENKIKQVIAESDGVSEIQDIKNSNKITKLEFPGSKINNTKLKIIYEIEITNEGTIEGNIEKIINKLPTGVTLQKKDNPNWNINPLGELIYNKNIKLDKEETKKIDLILIWDLKENNIGAKKNYVSIDSKQDIDQMLIQEGILELENTNNATYLEMIVAVKTGENVTVILITALLCLSIFTVGIYLIRRYVI